MIAQARPEPELDSEPSYNQLKLALLDFEDAFDRLGEPRWPVASSNPRLKAVEGMRTAIRALADSAAQILRSEASLQPVTDGHWNDRPEDCPCPACRKQVDEWALAYHNHVELVDPSEHPKVNPLPDEREITKFAESY